jgi:hypothetical protein
VDSFTKEELEEAIRAIASTISKCEKVQPKLKEGTSQHTLLIRRIKALQIASALIVQALESQNEQSGHPRMGHE